MVTHVKMCCLIYIYMCVYRITEIYIYIQYIYTYFEFRVFCFLGKFCTTSVTHLAFFALIIFEMEYHFLPPPQWTVSLLFVLFTIAMRTDICYHAQLFLLRQSLANFLPGQNWKHDLLDLNLLSS
jgi:hypothetical protein